MSVRGTITSRTSLSPISMIPWIISRSSSSMTPCSSDTWSSVISSCSVRYGARAARPPVIARDTSVMNHSTGRRTRARASTGPAARSARLSARRIAMVFGVTSAKMSRNTDSPSDTSRSPRKPKLGGM